MAGASHQRVVQLLLGALLLVAVAYVEVVKAQGWIDGRATFFADTNDPWQMSHGHCRYGYLNPNKCTGWDVAALADQNDDFNYADSNCGRCYEVRCKNTWISDGYGANFDRSYVCWNQGASVVVQVVDKCECNYAPNAYSNRRWCCGDKQHMDLSVFAFEKLASKIWGVIPIQFRRVACNAHPAVEAKRPNGVPQTPIGERPPAGWDGSDGRSCPGSGAGSSGRRSSRTPRRRTKTKRKSRKSKSNVSVGSWNVNRWSGGGVGGRTAQACGTLLPWGGFSIQGGLQNKRRVTMWLKRDGGSLPNVVVTLQGKGRCRRKHINRLPKGGKKSGYTKVTVNLKSFGCSGARKVVIQNNIGSYGWQNFCVDGVRSS